MRVNTPLAKAQKLFCCVLLAVTLMCLFLEFVYLPPVYPPPRPVPPKTFITCECEYERRLGNLMFTYASMLGIARRNNMTPILVRENKLSEIFDLHCAMSDDMENTLGRHVSYEEYGRRGSAYDRNTERLVHANTRLLGYFQSFKYFENVADTVRANFQFKESIGHKADEFLSSSHQAEWHDFIRVGIHVRRGDMIEEYFQRFGYSVAPVDYFLNAMEYFTSRFQRVRFIVCSDDIDWSRENIVGENVVYSIGHSQEIDLAILSRCDHVIMSVGSFSWWAAWLANGTTIYYDKWPRPFTQLEYNVNKFEYFPRHWIPMH